MSQELIYCENLFLLTVKCLSCRDLTVLALVNLFTKDTTFSEEQI